MKGLLSYWWTPLSQLCLLLFPLSGAAESEEALISRLEALLRQQQADRSIIQQVTITTPARLLPDCPSPQLQLASYARLSGNMSVTARCGKLRHFFQINVRAHGDYWVAARPLTAGITLSRKDIVRKQGDLAGLPRDVVFAAQSVTDTLTTRAINAGQPLAANMLRTPWKVRQGNEVAVITIGKGFRIRHNGKAMNNAAVGDLLRVRLASGQMVRGVVDK